MSNELNRRDEGHSFLHDGDDDEEISALPPKAGFMTMRNISYRGRGMQDTPSVKSLAKRPRGKWDWLTHGKPSRFWTWEVLASAFSILCIFIIVGVLKYEDGKRLSRWSLMIPPNAVISFIATLVKASCLLVLAEVIGQLRWLYFSSAPRRLGDLQTFDDASRGPFGALKLLILKNYKASLASLASILIVASLMVDPFAQLVLSFPSRLTAESGHVASMSVAQDYYVGTQPVDYHGPTGAVPQNAPLQLQSAVISAAYGVEPQFALSCPTSNCTFPPVETLGVCGHCFDVTSTATTTCEMPDFEESCNTTISDTYLPGVSFTWNVSSDATGIFATVWNSSTIPVVSEIILTEPPLGQTAAFAMFNSIKIDQEVFTQNERPDKPSSVNQCVFVYCIKSYPAIRVNNGVTDTGPVGEDLLSYASAVYSTNPTSQSSYFAFNMQTNVNSSNPGKNYTMSYIDHSNLGQFMYDIFNSSIGLLASQPDILGGGTMAPAFGIALYNADNLTTLVDRVADSMSLSMRTSQYNITTVNGTAYVVETYIQIEWKWLALPILISFFSLVLLLIVIYCSRMQGIEAWKSSSMPLLFYRLDGWQDAVHDFRDADDMMAMSEYMWGQLSLNKDRRSIVRRE